MSHAKKNKTLIFEYNNYRDYLRDYYVTAKANDKKISFRYLSRAAGFSSSGFFLKVMNGQSNLSMSGIGKISKALKHNQEEGEFFKHLVLHNQATSPDERQKYAEKLLRSKTFRSIYPLKESQYHYFSTWYYSILRELVCLSKFKEDPNWIAKTLKPNISAAEAAKGIEDLLKLGLLERNSSGRLIQSSLHVTSGDEITFSGAVRCHKQYIDRASDSIENTPRERRDISSMTLGVSKEVASLIKEKVQSFRQEVVELVSQNNSDVETVYLLNIQLFPVLSEEGE